MVLDDEEDEDEEEDDDDDEDVDDVDEVVDGVELDDVEVDSFLVSVLVSDLPEDESLVAVDFASARLSLR